MEKGGEDGYFAAPDSRSFGVADGVGGWADDGVDPGLFARRLLSLCLEAGRLPWKMSFIGKESLVWRDLSGSIGLFVAMYDKSLINHDFNYASGYWVLEGIRGIFKGISRLLWG